MKSILLLIASVVLLTLAFYFVTYYISLIIFVLIPSLLLNNPDCNIYKDVGFCSTLNNPLYFDFFKGFAYLLAFILALGISLFIRNETKRSKSDIKAKHNSNDV